MFYAFFGQAGGARPTPAVAQQKQSVGANRQAADRHWSRFDWLYVTTFVSPATGEIFWYVHDGVSKPFFEALLKTFAREAGAGRDRTIILVLDNAGWHGEAGLDVPDGVRLVVPVIAFDGEF
jgi:hypothetical protein